ncbi:hypothetical protein RB597_000981 [Gaeumannomyces tritici]
MGNNAPLPAPRRKSDTGSQPISPAPTVSPLHSQTPMGHPEKQDEGIKISSTEASVFLDGSDHGGHAQHAFEPVPCRGASNKKFWDDAVLDILQVLLVIPFFCLGIIVLVQDGKTTTEVKWIHHITAAISYGPTVFPILFSLIIGRLMKAALRWRLERRATVETIEQLHGSRTVTSAIITQIKLQSFNLLAIGIVLLWALSPVGSQAALRIAAIVPVVKNVGFNLTYLDVRNQFDPFDVGTSRSLATGLFTSSILVSQSDEGWDAWGNMKVPMIESLEGDTPSLNWISTEGRNVSYASLIGIPAMINSTFEAAEGIDVAFSLDTSYWWMNCSTQIITNDSWVFPDHDLARAEDGINSLVAYDFKDQSTRMARESVYSRRGASTDPKDIAWLPINDTTAKIMDYFDWRPRRLDLIANNTRKAGSRFVAKCNMTTTFVTINATCSGAVASRPLSTSSPLQRCRPTAVRRLQLNETRSTVTILDFLRVSRNNTGRAVEFLQDFVAASPSDASPHASLHVGYLANPNSPGSFERDFPDWTAVSARDFGMRFARLLNTYWVAAVGYKPMQGNFDRKTAELDQLGDAPGGLGGVFNYVDGGLGTAGIPHEALKADATWAAVLLVVSGVLLGAAVATLVLNVRRRTPGGIENFSNMLRDTPHAQVMLGGQKWPLTMSSMLDGFERSRLLKDVVVQVGDVAPAAPYGYLAVGTPETVEMERLKKGRKYM